MSTCSQVVRRATAIKGAAVHCAKPAAWLARAITVAQRMPVVLDVPGVPADQVPCIVPLADLERLRADAALLAQMRILWPDRVDETAAFLAVGNDSRQTSASGGTQARSRKHVQETV